MIKILVYSTIFSSGGAERFVLDLINNINLKKFEIILVIGRKKHTSYLSLLKKHKNIKYINLNFSDEEDYLIYESLGKVIKQENPDICFSPGIFTNFILLDAINSINYSGKIIIRESNFITTRNLPEDAKKKLLEYNKCDGIVSLTKGMKKDLKKYGVDGKKIVLINNPVDIDFVKKQSLIKVDNTEFNGNKHRKIINVGRLEKQKNQKLLLEAYNYVYHKYDDVDLFIIGRGTEKENLETYAKKLEIEDRVHFVDFQDNPYYFIKNSDLFVLSSLYEGLPHVLLEALALKTLVVSTDCKTGPRDILRNSRYGYLAKNNNAKSLAQKMIKALNSNNNKTELGYERSIEFDVKKVVKEYEQLFMNIKRGD